MMTTETNLQAFSRLIDGYVNTVAERQRTEPLETVDRMMVVSFTALDSQPWSRNELIGMLTITVDRLAIQKVGAP